MIVRTWRGAVRADEAEAYLEYLRRTGFPDYAATPGHLGTLVLRRTAGDTAEYLLMTAWSSPEAVRAFAGPDPDRAVFYPEDQHYLVAADERVQHFEATYVEGTALSDSGGADAAQGQRARESSPVRRLAGPLRPAHGWWWRGWVAHASAVARARGVGADFR